MRVNGYIIIRGCEERKEEFENFCIDILVNYDSTVRCGFKRYHITTVLVYIQYAHQYRSD